MRASLYAGLSQVLTADPRCTELLAELLLPHLERYVDGGGGLPPLHLEKCVATHQVRLPRKVGAQPLPAVYGGHVAAAV